MSKKLAIIGASSGQLPLCLKAKELGLELYVFAWDKNAVCKSVADQFIPISITEKEQITDICKQIGINGVTSNCSDLTAEVVSYIATELGLPGVNYDQFLAIRDKYDVRNKAQAIKGLTPIRTRRLNEASDAIFPCVVKPVNGSSKFGVTYVACREELDNAVAYASAFKSEIIIEEFIPGHEISVETISCRGKHYIVQITDKDTSGAPHFVELGHHQPARLPAVIAQKVQVVVPELLSLCGLNNSPAHIEFKYNETDLYLIEINPRGGGDEISNKLVQLSSGHDYLRYIIEIALDDFHGLHATPKSDAYAGIYFLCQQTKQYLPVFTSDDKPDWLIEKHIEDPELINSTTNYDRNGYIIYRSTHKIELA